MFDPKVFSVPIINYDDGIPDVQGSGVLIRVDSIPFVITAKHVLEKGFKKVGIGMPIGDQWGVIGHEAAPIMGATSLKNEGDTQRAVYPGDKDLAVMALALPIATELSKYYRFFDLRKNSPPVKSPWTVVSGYVAAENYFDPETGCHFRGCCRVQCPSSHDWEVRKLRGIKGTHFAVRLNPKKMNFLDATTKEKVKLNEDIGGISGSGVSLACRGATMRPSRPTEGGRSYREALRWLGKP